MIILATNYFTFDPKKFVVAQDIKITNEIYSNKIYTILLYAI